MKISELIGEFEKICPRQWRWHNDKVGLFCGDPDRAVEKVLLALDPTDEVIEEAIEGKYDLLFTHHPLSRSDFPAVNAQDYIGGKLYRAIQNNLAIYSAHTNLDFAPFGVSVALAEILGVKFERYLHPHSSEKLYKIVVFVPRENFELFRKQFLDIGVGHIGNYSHTSFSVAGEGTFMPHEGANPYIGTVGKLEKVEEYRLETIVLEHLLGEALVAIRELHPYEEPAVDIYPLQNNEISGGFGVVGTLDRIITLEDLARACAEKLPTDEVKVAGDMLKSGAVRKVAVLGGTGDSFVKDVIAAGVDAFIAGELSHHSALELKSHGVASIVAGHFGTEWVVLPNLKKIILDIFEKYQLHGKVDIARSEGPVFRSIFKEIYKKE
ncbi:Nif3-like dinuclear metal center hexameric protein [bacterium]|nr:Nif3-like dinuclear metal center hexameric protein [bacterium]